MSASTRFRTSLLLALCFAGLTLIGCKAKEAKSTGFVHQDEMANDPSLPFHKVWKKPGFDKAAYRKLYVAPVNTAYMLQSTDWQKGTRKEEIEQDVVNLGLYTEEAIKKAFREDTRQRMDIVETRPNSSDALIIEVALTEVIPSKVVLNALGFAPFFIGTTLNAVRAMSNDVSSVAFEARIRDAGTGEIVATMADREVQQVSIVSARGLTWYGHAQTIITQWAGQFVEVANRRPGETVKDTQVFTLKPW